MSKLLGQWSVLWSHSGSSCSIHHSSAEIMLHCSHSEPESVGWDSQWELEFVPELLPEEPDARALVVTYRQQGVTNAISDYRLPYPIWYKPHSVLLACRHRDLDHRLLSTHPNSLDSCGTHLQAWCCCWCDVVRMRSQCNPVTILRDSGFHRQSTPLADLLREVHQKKVCLALCDCILGVCNAFRECVVCLMTHTWSHCVVQA